MLKQLQKLRLFSEKRALIPLKISSSRLQSEFLNNFIFEIFTPLF